RSSMAMRSEERTDTFLRCDMALSKASGLSLIHLISNIGAYGPLPASGWTQVEGFKTRGTPASATGTMCCARLGRHSYSEDEPLSSFSWAASAASRRL